MAALNHAGEELKPAGGNVAQFHGAEHAVFQRMYDAFIANREIMANVPTN